MKGWYGLARAAAAGTALIVALTGCEGDDGAVGPRGPQGEPGPQGPQGEQGPAAPEPAFVLQLLHFADIDGSGGTATAVNFSALVDGFRERYPENTLLVSSGDNLIPGPEFFAAGDSSLAGVLGEPGNGRANIAWLNFLGVQASALGNHDLDTGAGDLAELIDTDGLWGGARFPYLAANVDVSGSALAGLEVADGAPARPRSVAASATVLAGGEVIGLVGASVPTLPTITNTSGLVITPTTFDPAVDADLDALAAEIQPAVDALVAEGIDKIVLLAHMQQLAIERALAERLTDVDIIVAGGSNTILADGNDRLRDGDTAADTYPLTFTSPSGEPVLVVNTDGDFNYLGRLVVEFDDTGVIDLASIDPALSGAYASDIVQFPFSPLDGVEDVVRAVEDVLLAKDGNVLGVTDVYLDGRRSEVRTEETNLGNLTADANLWLAQQEDASVQISLKNGGGIRDDIGQALVPPGSNDPDDVQFLPPDANDAIGKPAGGISQLDLETSLRFNNGLTLLTVTAAELADIVEHAVAATGAGATPGRFPQVAGIRFSFDPTRTARSGTDTNAADPAVDGDRLRNLAVVDGSGAVVDQVVIDGAVDGDPDRTFRLVILDFIAKCVGVPGEDCGDGYPLNGLADPQRVDVSLDPGLSDFADPGTEQDALAEYLQTFFAPGGTAFDTGETDPADDTRIQNLEFATDTVFP